jgi:hypothetical protein
MYPIHKKLEMKYREFWKQSKDIDDFLKKAAENKTDFDV